MTAGGHPSRSPETQPPPTWVDPDGGPPQGRPVAPTRNGLRQHHLTLPSQPESVPAARHFLRMMLLEWGLHRATEVVELAASELLTNAVVHARTSFEVTVVAEDDLTVSVRDTGGSFPTHLTSEEGFEVPGCDEGGRGLMIVAAVADRWGVVKDASSTTVWFQIRLTPATAGGPPQGW